MLLYIATNIIDREVYDGWTVEPSKKAINRPASSEFKVTVSRKIY